MPVTIQITLTGETATQTIEELQRVVERLSPPDDDYDEKERFSFTQVSSGAYYAEPDTDAVKIPSETPPNPEQTPDPKATTTDVNGVPYHAQYCSGGDQPMYASGKRQGQWKKRRGVADVEYDSWYAAELQKIKSEQIKEPIDASAAFGTNPALQPTETVDVQATQSPENFLRWVAERQAAQVLTDQDMQAAYKDTGIVGVNMLFDPTASPEAIKMRISALYNYLSNILGRGR